MSVQRPLPDAPHSVGRRTVLRGAAGVAAGAGLAACGGSTTPAASTSVSTTTVTTVSSETGEADHIGEITAASSVQATSGATDAASALNTLGPVSDVKVGSGVVYKTAKVVVTQPAAGTFKGFTAVCTHQGCIVDNVSNGVINCNCHGSQFSITDGSVVQGPATQALAEEKVNVTGETVKLGDS